MIDWIDVISSVISGTILIIVGFFFTSIRKSLKKAKKDNSNANIVYNDKLLKDMKSTYKLLKIAFYVMNLIYFVFLILNQTTSESSDFYFYWLLIGDLLFNITIYPYSLWVKEELVKMLNTKEKKFNNIRQNRCHNGTDNATNKSR